MLGIQNQTHIQPSQAVSFKGEGDYRSYISDEGYDSFDRDSIDAERDEKMDKLNEQKQQFEDLAQELENSDNKYAKKAGKGIRFAAAICGIVGTFIMAKYSSKVAIETIKQYANNPAGKKVLESLEGAKEPAKKAFDGIKKYAKKFVEKPAIKSKIDKLVNSKTGKMVTDALNNEKVAKLLDPVKKSLSSLKDIKLNGKNIQSAIENTMAATATGSVIVDNLTGRNNKKSNAELATGV